jgi:hypothetical protein
LTGLVDVPVILDVEEDVATETIGIEFSPRGAYRFFHFNFNDIQNQIYALSDVLGIIGKRLTEQINSTISGATKNNFIATILTQATFVARRRFYF